MTTHRMTTPLVVALAAGLSLASGASANPLLSGYGGPGQGSQTILGSVLVKGSHGGGGGSAGAGGAASASAPAGASGAGSAGASGASSAGAHGAGVPTGTGGAQSSRSGAEGVRSPTGQSAAEPAPATGVYTASERAAAPTSQALGITGEDLALVILVLGTLLCTGVLTGRLARTTQRGEPARSSSEPQKPTR
jgi:hypothetical protein